MVASEPSRPETEGAATPDEPRGMLAVILADRIVTWPNVITVARLGLVPLFLWLLFSVEDRAAAAVVLGVMGATDWFDGQVARRFDQVSELGKILDPAADRIVLIIAVVSITVDGSVPAWLGIPVLIREPVMFVAVPLLAMMGAERIDVTWYGKAGTFLLMFAFPLLLYGASDAPLNELGEVAGYLCGVPGLVLSYYAALLYIPMARRALREGRRR